MLRKLIPFVLVLAGCLALPCSALKASKLAEDPLGSIESESAGNIDPLVLTEPETERRGEIDPLGSIEIEAKGSIDPMG